MIKNIKIVSIYKTLLYNYFLNKIEKYIILKYIIKMSCQYEDCNGKLFENNYCKKHEKLRLKNEGLNICSARDCLNILINTQFKQCETCREKDRNLENKRNQEKKLLNEKSNNGEKICKKCNKDFTKNKSEKLCDECYDKLQIIENNRKTINDFNLDDTQKCIKCEKEYKIKIFEGSKKRVLKVCYYCRNNILEEKINVTEIKIDNHDKRKRLCDYDKNYEKICEKCNIKKNIVNFSDCYKRVTNTCYGCVQKNGILIEDNEIKLEEEVIERQRKYTLDCKKNKIKKIGLEEYHKKNNETMQKYRENNKNKLNDYRNEYRQKTKSLYDELKIMTSDKNIEMSLTMDQFENLIQQICFYCGDIEKNALWGDKTTRINGIDRIDSEKGYIENNVVSCCSFCNYSKNTLSVSKFLRQIFHILSFNKKIKEKISYPNAFEDCKNVSYSDYHRRANKKSIEFNITKKLFEEIKSLACYLCGKENDVSNIIGIDRVDSKKGYVEDNIMPCCKSCNYIKKNYDLEYMFNKFLKIYTIHKNDTLVDECDERDIRNKNTVYKKTKEEQKSKRKVNKKIKNEILLNKYTDENIEKRIKQSMDEMKTKKIIEDVEKEQKIKNAVLDSFT